MCVYVYISVIIYYKSKPLTLLMSKDNKICLTSSSIIVTDLHLHHVVSGATLYLAYRQLGQQYSLFAISLSLINIEQDVVPW